MEDGSAFCHDKKHQVRRKTDQGHLEPPNHPFVFLHVVDFHYIFVDLLDWQNYCHYQCRSFTYVISSVWSLGTCTCILHQHLLGCQNNLPIWLGRQIGDRHSETPWASANPLPVASLLLCNCSRKDQIAHSPANKERARHPTTNSFCGSILQVDLLCGGPLTFEFTAQGGLLGPTLLSVQQLVKMEFLKQTFIP